MHSLHKSISFHMSNMYSWFLSMYLCYLLAQPLMQTRQTYARSHIIGNHPFLLNIIFHQISINIKFNTIITNYISCISIITWIIGLLNHANLPRIQKWQFTILVHNLVFFRFKPKSWFPWLLSLEAWPNPNHGCSWYILL